MAARSSTLIVPPRWKQSEPTPGRDYPFWGYAPGEYVCRCHICQEWFVGAKRSWTCEDCAENLDAEQRDEECVAHDEMLDDWCDGDDVDA